MAACSTLQSPISAHVPAAFTSGSSSGDEGSTRLRRRWSVNGGGQDASLPPLHVAPLGPTVEIPSKVICDGTVVGTSSTPSSPAKRVQFDVKAMFQLDGSADAVGGLSLEDEVLPKEGVPPEEISVEEEVPPEGERPLEDEVSPEEETPLEDEGHTAPVPSTAAQASSEDERYGVHMEPTSAAAQVSPKDEVSALLSKLSKLTLPSVSDKIVAWANQSPDEDGGRTLSKVADLMFEKANDNAAKSELYAELCHIVMERIDPDIHDEAMKDADGEFMPGPRVFRRYLISRCEDGFERGLGGEGEPSIDATQRNMALIKFIGELFNVRMLTLKIVYECLERLLTNFEWARGPDLYIDCLDVLLTTAGRRLADFSKARAHMDIYFGHIQNLSRNTAVSPLHRMKLQSIISQRQGWKTGRATHTATASDNALGGHVLGDMNLSSASRKQSQRLASTDSPCDISRSPPAPETKTLEEPPPARPISESEAIARAEENSARFFSVRDVAAAEKYFAGLPPGYHHFLVDSLVDKALFSEDDASLVAVLFDRVASDNLCSAAAFEDGFSATTKHLSGIAMDMPDAFEAYVRMFKGAHLDADADRCMRIVGMSGMGDELMPLLFGSAEPTAPLEPSPPSPTPSHVSEPAMSVELDTPANATGTTNDEALESVSPCTVQSDPQPLEDDDDDDLYADYTESPTISSSSTSPSPTAAQQQQILPQQAGEQHISIQAPSAPGLCPAIEERVPEPPDISPLSPTNDLPLIPVRLRMSQQEAHERIEQSVALLFGGPHDIDRALSVFTVVPARHHSRLVDRLVSFAIESTRADAQLVAYFLWGAAAKGLCAPAAFEGGFALTAAALEDIAAESPDAVLLFATMARGAGLHKDTDWSKRVFGRLEAVGYGPDLASLS